MQRVLEMMREALLRTWEVTAPVLADVPAWAWLAVAGLVVLLVAIRATRPSRPAKRAPELLLTRAEMAPCEEANGHYRLIAAFSNLHYEPVQLLRIAATGADKKEAVVASSALVLSRRTVEIETDLDIGGGGRGRLDLYLYVPSSSARAWRLRVPLIWEPWSRHYTARTLDQRVTPARRLPEPPPAGRSVRPGTRAEPVRTSERHSFPERF
ncbi:MAG: hypothetical protein GVY27_10485 [Deinococcus-Thermus bacterium]|jgi:hypothetical protein|nr:hypothetical protein [Deinococcota bacterium]